MNNRKERIRIIQPDGTIKVLFKDVRDNKPESKGESRPQPKNKPEARVSRYSNPWFPNLTDIFGVGMIGEEVQLQLLNDKVYRGILKGVGQYDVLISLTAQNFNLKVGTDLIIMKGSIITVQVVK